jgi:hypothetical protein
MAAMALEIGPEKQSNNKLLITVDYLPQLFPDHF